MRMLRLITVTAALSVMAVFAFLGVVHLLDIVAGTLVASPIAVSRHRVDFGTIPLNRSATQQLIVRNDGQGPLHARFSVQGAAYRVEPDELYLEPGIEWKVTVETCPEQPGRLVDLLRIQIVGGQGAAVVIPLEAEAASAEPAFDPGDELTHV